jgi:Tfp pilus assembly protein PilF
VTWVVRFLLALLLAAGCATQRPPVAKLVGGRVILTRSVDPNAYEHVARALLYEEEERYEDAILELRRALNFDRDAPEVHARIAEIYLKLDKVDDAARAVKESLELGESVDGLVADAHVRERRGDHAGAVASLRKAAAATRLGQQPADGGDADSAVSAYLELADAQLAGLDVDGARTTLRTLADGLPGSTLARLRLCAVAWALGAPGECERRLREALAVEPNHIECLLTLAWLYTAEGRTDEARARFSEALERSEGALDVAAAYARFLMAAGKAKEATELADDLGTPSADDDEALLGRIEVERAAHRSDQALALARTRRSGDATTEDAKARLDIISAEILADRDPAQAVQALLRVPRTAASFAESRLRAAEILRDQNKPADAAKALAEAEAASPSEAMTEEITIGQAMLDERRGNVAGALARLDQALQKRGSSRRLRMARAMMLERNGRWQEALAAAERVIADDPSSSEALNFWGFVAADQNHELGRARQRIRAALSFDPGSGAILDSLGWVHVRMNDLQAASQYLEQAVRLEPEDPEILSHVAELYRRKGLRDHARERLRKALGAPGSAKPDPSLRKKLEQQLRNLDGGHDGAKPAAAPGGT